MESPPGAPTTDDQTRNHVSRRAVLRRGVAAGVALTGGTAVAGRTTVTGTARAHPKPENHEVLLGDNIDYLDGTVRTFATRNPEGALSSLGVYIDERALSVFDEDGLDAHLALPEGLDTPFTFFGFHYEPTGHPPQDVYTVPHFDFHFYLMPHESVEAIATGPAAYSIPSTQLPTDYQRPPLLDTDDDGEPDAPLVEGAMGEHLVDPTASEFQEGGEFTHTMIYGAYDPDGDGTGQLTFLEPMVTLEFLRDLEETVEVDVKTPEAYPAAGAYPTRYVVSPELHGGVYVFVDEFTEFPGVTE